MLYTENTIRVDNSCATLKQIKNENHLYNRTFPICY
jgi:hypothetical protein